MTGKARMKPPKIEIRTWVMKPCCSPVKISSGFWPCSTSSSASGAARKLKIGPATVKAAIIATQKATSELISRVRSSARCSISGAVVSSICRRRPS